MINFFTQFRVATEAMCKAPWSKGRSLFYCAFCGKSFVVGDEYKAIFTNNIVGAGGNPLCCRACYIDEQAMRTVWQERNREWEAMYNGKWRWFREYQR